MPRKTWLQTTASIEVTLNRKDNDQLVKRYIAYELKPFYMNNKNTIINISIGAQKLYTHYNQQVNVRPGHI